MQQAMPGQVTGHVSGAASQAKRYGALLDEELKHDAEAGKMAFAHGRRRLNCFPVILAFLTPWLTFILSFSIAAFYVHYAAPLTTTLLLGCVLLRCLYCMPSYRRGWKQSPNDGFYQYYLVCAIFWATAIGWVYGDFVFYRYMEPSYEAGRMVTYAEVNPSSMRMADGEVAPTRGGRFQDAGKVYFNHNTILDLDRAATFKLSDVYCVAPIRDTTCSENCGQDFWAVGKNCCSEDGKHWMCGDAGDKRAKSGLRLMENNDVASYRLAVLSASSKYQMVSPHPLFFHWLVDPVQELRAWEKHGFRRFIVAMFGSFGVSIVALYYILKTHPDWIK